jgi:hypothetical protein
MLKFISFKFAVTAMLVILTLVSLFHAFILTEIIPFSFVCEGEFQTVHQMRSVETDSLLINVLMMLVIAIKGKVLKLKTPVKLINIFLWVFVIYLTLNTIGNLVAKTCTETILFSPITLVSAILCLRLALESKNK